MGSADDSHRARRKAGTRRTNYSCRGATIAFLKIGKDYWLQAESIEIIQPWPNRASERERQRAQAAQCFYDATGGKKTLSIVTLKSGWVFASPFLPDALVSRPTVAAPSRAASRGAGREDLTPNGKMSEAMTGAVEMVSVANGKG